MTAAPYPPVLDGVDALPWARLEHNYGTAEDIPDLLRGVAAGTEPADGDLANHLFHQGGWVSPAATAALPFLAGLAALPTVVLPDRLGLLELVGDLARTARTAEPRFVDPGWPEAWQRSLPALLALPTADAEPAAVRRAAVEALGEAPEPGAETVELLRERWERDGDGPTRLAALHALGRTAARAGAQQRARTAAYLEALLADARPAVRITALHALACIDPDAPARRVDLLCEAFTAPGAATELAAAWAEMNLAQAVSWSFALVLDRPAAATGLVVRLAAAEGPAELRAAAMDCAGQLLLRWRSPTAALLPVLARGLEDTEPAVRVQAAHLLAALGAASAPYADRLAARLDDHARRPERWVPATVADNALWALTRCGGPRYLPGLVARLHARQEVFAPYSSHSGLLGLHDLPGMHEVLIPLRAHAKQLVPQVAALMREVRKSGDWQAARAGTEVLAAWGDAALPALGELIALLADPRLRGHAARALAAIGPSAAEALPYLRPAPGTAAAGSREAATERQLFAWARARLGDDPARALDVLGPALAADGVFHTTTRYVGDLGTAAVSQAGRLRVLLATGYPVDWTSVEAAIALWKVTGDPEPSRPALEETVRPLAEGRHLPVMHRALEALTEIGEIGEPTRAALTSALESDQLLGSAGNWRRFAEDQRIRAAARTLLRTAAG